MTNDAVANLHHGLFALELGVETHSAMDILSREIPLLALAERAVRFCHDLRRFIPSDKVVDPYQRDCLPSRLWFWRR